MVRASPDPDATAHGGESRRMFVFYTNRLGCAGSILASVVLSALLILAVRSCGR
jgi:hypothetical protein